MDIVAKMHCSVKAQKHSTAPDLIAWLWDTEEQFNNSLLLKGIAGNSKKMQGAKSADWQWLVTGRNTKQKQAWVRVRVQKQAGGQKPLRDTLEQKDWMAREGSLEECKWK